MIFYSLIFLIVLTFFYGLRNTVFEISWKKKGFAGILIAREIFILIIAGVVIFHHNGTDGLVTFFITTQSIEHTELIILTTVLVMLLLISILSKTVFRRYLYEGKSHRIIPLDGYAKNEFYLLYSIVLLLVVLNVIFLSAGMRNALLEAIVFGRELMEARLHNVYGTSVPTFMISFYKFLVYFFAIAIGILSRYMSKFILVLLLIFLFFSSGFFGDKAPIVISFFLFVLGMVSRVNITFRKMLMFAIPLFITPVIIVYILARVQYPELKFDSFMLYLVQRIGIGQIQGVYEQFALNIIDISYIWHTVPFANFFMEAPAFNKDLMMSTWGQNLSSDSVGVMNSYFIGEALAIGGYTLVYFSPLIVAFNYCLTFVVFYILFKKYFSFGKDISGLYIKLLLPTFIIFTGDITGLLFLKITIMLLVFLTLIFIVFRLIKSLLTSKVQVKLSS